MPGAAHARGRRPGATPEGDGRPPLALRKMPFSRRSWLMSSRRAALAPITLLQLALDKFRCATSDSRSRFLRRAPPALGLLCALASARALRVSTSDACRMRSSPMVSETLSVAVATCLRSLSTCGPVARRGQVFS